MVIISFFVIHAFFSHLEDQLDRTPLHYHFLIAYFIASVILEVLMMIFKTQELKKIAVTLGTQESDEKFSDKLSPPKESPKESENQYHTITIVNENPSTNEFFIKETYKDAFKQTPKYVIEKQPAVKQTNKDQVTNLIEAQNSIRNLLNNKKPDTKKS